jgi:hypothetical protein
MKRAPLMMTIFAGAVVLSAQAPVVRAKLEPASGILVGQPVRLVVEVLVPNYFTGSPDFSEFEIENAIVVLPQERPLNSSQRINGTTYAGISETYTVYPQQPGNFELPHVQISISYAAAPPKTTVARVSIPRLRFHAELPAAAQGLDYFLPTTELTMQQKWSAPVQNLRVGDTIRRTITVTAMRMQAMLIPPLPLDAPDGIRIYQDQPVVEGHKTSRGDFVSGKRVQSAQYLIQKEGAYTLPPIELKWWNLTTRRMVTASLPAVHFIAAPNPGLVAELPPEAEPAATVHPEPLGFWRRYGRSIGVALPIAAACLLLIWLNARYTPGIRRHLRAWHLRRTQSEPYLFHKLVRACRRNNAKGSYTLLVRWLRRWRPNLTLEQVIAESHDQDFAAQVDHLGKAVFSVGGDRQSWRGGRLAALLKRVRETKGPGNSARVNLPMMNPGQ